MASDDNRDIGAGGKGRRDFLRQSAGLATGASLVGSAPAAMAGLVPGAHLAGSDAPEKREVRVGFMPLTDCASVVVAAAEGFDIKHGIRIVLSRQTSWAAVRDQLANGSIDAAHMLYGMVYGLQLGIGGPRLDMNVLLTLNQNGQGISFANQMAAMGASDGESLARLVASSPAGAFSFAQTFPTGTHAMWLYYWLAAHGIHPLDDVRSIVVPPPQMIAACRAGIMHGFCVGEPWNQLGIDEGVSFSVASSQDVWPDHPEKVLGTTAAWTARHPNAARALSAALIDAGRWLDESDANRRRAAELIAGAAFVDAPAAAIAGRMCGSYEDGCGRRWQDAHRLAFFRDGEVSYPYASDATWLLTQFRRWGLVDADPDYAGIVARVNRGDIYADAAAAVGASLPTALNRSHTLMDGVTWDGSNPQAYAAGFALHA